VGLTVAAAAGSGMGASVVVGGVAGVGKSAVAQAVAARLGVAFADADDFHPAANVAKMRAGIPLDEADRRGWLADLARWLGERDAAVLACSALRRSHRDALRGGGAPLVFVQLRAEPDVLTARIEARCGHFMPASLLADQLATLEPLAPDEAGFVVDAGPPLEQVVDRVVAGLARS
jgi:gluconokinase